MRITFLTSADAIRPIGDDEVHLWSLALEANEVFALLTDEERARAERFKMERIRRQFISSRGLLRRLLAGYLAIRPAAVSIIREPSGKPYLDPALGSDIHFNVSHSDLLGVFAITRCRRIGVDIERWREMPQASSLIERFFTRREGELFQSLPESERLAAFFRVWTRKEATLKAIGRGVQSLDQCDVTFCPGEDERVLRMGDDHAAAEKWLLRSWKPNDDFVAAVAVELKNGERTNSYG